MKATAKVISGDFTAALEFLSTAVVMQPENPKLYRLRASIFRKQQLFRKALDDLELAMQNTPFEARRPSDAERELALTFNDMALESFGQKNFEQALAEWNKAIELNSTVYEFYVNRGDCFREVHDYEKALLEYQKAKSMYSGPPIDSIDARISLIYHKFGMFHFNNGDFGAAEKEFTTAIKYCSRVPSFYLHRGNALFYQQKSAEAAKDYEKVLKMEPSNTQASERLVCLRSNVSS
eukprot:231015_1